MLTKPGFLFAGPSLWADVPEMRLTVPADLCLLPPAARGDIPTLLARLSCEGHPPGVLVLADGRFHQGGAAVGHAELRTALEAGWEIWGVSSLGALRAWEMRDFGMRGFGTVYDCLIAADNAGEDFRDDEVALLYEPSPPYRPVSEPLVHLRCALKEWSAGPNPLLTLEDAARIAEELDRLWFGDRTLPHFATLARERLRDASRAEELRIAITRFDPWRVKTKDLRTLLQVAPWRETGDEVA